MSHQVARAVSLAAGNADSCAFVHEWNDRGCSASKVGGAAASLLNQFLAVTIQQGVVVAIQSVAVGEEPVLLAAAFAFAAPVAASIT